MVCVCVCVCVHVRACSCTCVKNTLSLTLRGLEQALCLPVDPSSSSIQPFVCPLAPTIPFDEALLCETVCGTNQKLERGEPPSVITSANRISTIGDDSLLILWKCFCI